MTESTLQHGAPRRPVVLIILDGFGVNPAKEHNAVHLANTPRLDEYFAQYPHTLLQASGTSVGVPDGQMGNSEIGHMTLGSGSIIPQDMVRINEAICSGEFFSNPALLKAIHLAKAKQRPLNLFGLVSDGGVHSSLGHLQALLRLCKQHGVKPLLHMVTDGRDTSPKSALNYLKQIESDLHCCGGAIATIMGRFFAMDRDQRWERVELAWRAMVHGKGQHTYTAETTIRGAYAAGDTDEFIRPSVLPTWQTPEPDDPLISFNFRKDRPREIISALGCKGFSGFDRGEAPLFSVTCMMPYDPGFKIPYAFVPEQPATTLAQVISEAGLQQFHCAETEKYPHVTYFFNGGRQEPYRGESRAMIPSPRVATYDMKPEMSASQVSNAVIAAIEENKFAFILVNFANGDMVGHTAKEDAVIEAVEVLDREAGRILDVAKAADYSVILTADHGNCEELINPLSGEAQTQHTLYPVPCLIIDEDKWKLSCNGGLANVAPTVLQIMGLNKPDSMAGTSLLLQQIMAQKADVEFQGAA